MIRHAYGPHPSQFGDFYAGRPPCRTAAVVVIHGGFWRPHRSVDMTVPLAAGLALRGWNAWNVEYRRAGQADWRGTLADCAAAIDHLASSAIVLGHSAGGQLAVWAARRAAGVTAVVSVAGVLDLDGAARAGIGDDAVAGFLGGGPDEVPDRYRDADPIARLPTGVPVHCVHSPDDERVPFEQSRRYVEAATRSGDDAALVEVEGAHADGIDLWTPAGQRVAAVLEALDA